MAERLKEQVNPYPLPGYTRRASAMQATQTAADPPASRHYAGHQAGIHPEDAPSMTQGQPRRRLLPHTSDDEEEAFSPQRPPSSARRYLSPPEDVYRQGNRQIVVHHGPPPKQRGAQWMLLVGIVLAIMVLGWMALSALGGWWQAKQEDWTYGMPRTFQVDHFVGHADSPQHPNHFVAINLHGIIEVVEINTQVPKADHIYAITTASDSTTPVSITFADANHDGKVDLLVTIGDSNPYTVILLNTGSLFAP